MSALTLPARPLFINNLESNPVFLYWKSGTGLAEGASSDANPTDASGEPLDTENYNPLAFNATTDWENLKGFRVKDWGSFFRPGLGKNEEITDVIVSNAWNPIKATLYLSPDLNYIGSGVDTKTLESYFVVRSRGKELEYQEYSENYDRKFNMQVVVKGTSAAILNNNYCVAVARYVQEMIDAGFKDLKYTLYSDLDGTNGLLDAGSHSALNAITTAKVVKIEMLREGLEFHKFVADDTYSSDFSETFYPAFVPNSVDFAAIAGLDTVRYDKGDFFEGINTYNKLKAKKVQTPGNVYPYSGNEDSFPVKGAKYTSIYIKKRIARPDLGGGVVVNQESAMTAEFLLYVNESTCPDFVEGFLRFLTHNAAGYLAHFPAAGTPLANGVFNTINGAAVLPTGTEGTDQFTFVKGTASAYTITAATYPAKYVA